MSPDPTALPLHEQLLLIGLDDERGSVVFSSSTALPYALAGAVILELLGRGLLAHVEGLLNATGSGSGDALLDDVLAQIRDAKKPRNIEYWVMRIPNRIKSFRNRIAQSLVDRGILRREKHHFLWVFEYSRFPEVDERPEQAILKKLRDAVLYDVPPDEEVLALLSLVRSAELVSEVFGKGERREAKKRIREMTREEVVSKAVSSAVAAANAAVMVAVTASVAAAAASSSSS